MDNLGLSARFWFELNFPSDPASAIPPAVRDWIEQINRLRPRSFFRPIILALLQKNFPESEKIRFLRAIERHEFLVFGLVNSRADANRAHFYRQANNLFDERRPIHGLIEEVHNRAGRFYSQDRFKEYIDELFDEGEQDDRGYFTWPELKYFLFEYEKHLRTESQAEPPVPWESCAFERVYPERSQRNITWHKDYDRNYTEEKCRKLCNSLGNIALCHTDEIEQMQSFEAKRLRYMNGLRNSREIAACKFWRHQEILERGVKMLGFVADHWEISLAEDIRKTLTQVGFSIETASRDE